jgi:nucleotide-binding universal stress UspA family protein
MKSVLLHVHDDHALDDRLSVALDVARAHKGHLSCLQVTPFNAYVSFEPLGAAYVSSALLQELRAREEELRAKIETRLSREDVPWDWAAADGDVAQQLVYGAALADLVIVSQTEAEGGVDSPLPIVDDVIVNAGCSTLVVPAGVKSLDCTRPVVIGWNASAEAARALRQSLSFLALASEVHLVSVGEDGEAFPQTAASSYLARHGVASELHSLPDRADAGQAIVDFAKSAGAGAIVMGAYGHSRLRETLLGGATRHASRNSNIPVLFGR